MSQLSALEQRRLDNIRQNEQFLSELQLDSIKPVRKKRPFVWSPKEYEKVRHSKRVAKLEPVKYDAKVSLLILV
jgi:hypothetical protein